MYVHLLGISGCPLFNRYQLEAEAMKASPKISGDADIRLSSGFCSRIWTGVV
jgi:hypothetical protein